MASWIIQNNVILAFCLTLFAGLATSIGGALSFFTNRTNTRFLAISLGFSAGVMIYVSMIEIFAKARDALVTGLGDEAGAWATAGAFFGGMFFIAFIDRMIPSRENPHEMHRVEEISQHPTDGHQRRLLRMGIFMALAIAIHNFPEGLATFVSTLQNPSLGVAIAIAIAIHNIPEGIAVAVPVYFATGSRGKAFLLSALSGALEPVGAMVGYFLLRSYLSDTVFGILFAGVAGIMVFISFDELLPSARQYGEHHLSIYGMVAGMMLMAVSLLLFL